MDAGAEAGKGGEGRFRVCARPLRVPPVALLSHSKVTSSKDPSLDSCFMFSLFYFFVVLFCLLLVFVLRAYVCQKSR